jgi:hypothetical protein
MRPNALSFFLESKVVTTEDSVGRYWKAFVAAAFKVNRVSDNGVADEEWKSIFQHIVIQGVLLLTFTSFFLPFTHHFDFLELVPLLSSWKWILGYRLLKSGWLLISFLITTFPFPGLFSSVCLRWLDALI